MHFPGYHEVSQDENGPWSRVYRLQKQLEENIQNIGLLSQNLENIHSGIIYDLIRCRAFEKARYRRKWLVIVDGTRLCSFKKENDEHCLHVTHRDRETGKESTTWYHTVLEAKIVLGDGLIVSIASEFIENNVEAQRQKEMNAEEIKQDCESKAFKRLA